MTMRGAEGVLSELPEGWSWMRLKMVASILHSNVDKHTVEGEEPVLLCNYVDVYKNDSITSDLDYMSATATPAQIKRFSLREGDVVITKDSETPEDIAVPAYVEASGAGLVCGYHLSILRALPKVMTGRFLYWAVLSEPVSAGFSMRAQGITRFGLTIGATGDVRIPVPPLKQQRSIAQFLDAECLKLDAMCAQMAGPNWKQTVDTTTVGGLIGRMLERRAALIAAAVSGRLEVAANVAAQAA